MEAGRGIAALLVVLFHTSKYYFDTPKYWTGDALHGVFLFGHAGVEFFFVLSGYIMLTVHRKDVGQPSKIVPFLRKRFLRIYPLFWLVLAVTLVLVFAVPSLGDPKWKAPILILESALMMGREPLDAVVFVSWSMWHEIVFYGLCALVIGLPRIGIPAFLLWTLACAIVPFTGLATPWPPYLTEVINVLFAMGVVAALVLRRYTIPRPGFVLAVGSVVFFGTGLVMDYAPILAEWSTRLLYGMGAALALVGAVELERSGRLAAPKWLVTLGGASYALYLTHILVLSLAAKVAAKLGLPNFIPGPMGFVLLASIAVGAGVAIHLLIDKPLSMAAGRIWRAQPVPA